MSSSPPILTTPQSIHPTICIANEDAIVTLRVPVELGQDTPLNIFPVSHDVYLSSSSFVPKDFSHTVSLSVLPPIHLRIVLPPSYPSQSPPIIQSLHATSAWLPPSTLPLIKERMSAMWSPGDESGILYTWVEWIRTGDFLTDIGFLADDMHSIQCVSPLSSTFLPHAVPHPSDSPIHHHTSFSPRSLPTSPLPNRISLRRLPIYARFV